jgi:phosphoadenosine phosphosulfate reductase
MTWQARLDDTLATLREAEALAPAAFASSLGVEDMLLLDLIGRHRLKIEAFTLDTGRLPPETYELIARAEEACRLRIKIYFPETQAVEQYVRINGVNGFYLSKAQRQDCCEIRKIGPLTRALAGKRCWVTGLRREQSDARADVARREDDKRFGLVKFNPLVDWTEQEVWDYVRANGVPYNALHDRGYPSIGCAPCTRAVKPGEPARAGRWWWEQDDQKECGLHVQAPEKTAA